jgi:peptidoglycan/xylan/chitin deacetylase (PgdA/CDA1 family)
MSALCTTFAVGSSAIAAAAGAMTYASMSPRNTLWGAVHSRGAVTDPPRYALTFDDGPTAGPTDAILDALAELNVRAAFFVVGVNARRRRNIEK